MFISCEDKNEQEEDLVSVMVARPLVMSLTDFENGVIIDEPRVIEESGKIYAYQDYIFINEKYQGVHVIDNSNPSAPKKELFIAIPGNVDISIKDDFLFADSLQDLVVLDISDMSNIQEVKRLKNVLRDGIVWPMADYFEYGDIDYSNEVILGWEVKEEMWKAEDVYVDDFIFTRARYGDAYGFC